MLCVKNVLSTITAVVVAAKAVTSLIEHIGKLQRNSTV